MDDGVKRAGPMPDSQTTSASEGNPSPPSTGRSPNYGKLRNLDVEAAIEEIAEGKLSKDIAARYSVTSASLRAKLAKHPRYKSAVRDQARSLVERATDEAMECQDWRDAAIARVKLDAAHRWGQAIDPETWAPQKAGVTVQVISADRASLGDLADILRTVSVQVPSDPDQLEGK